ncbi:MAG: NADH-quinone oxidoreductase subunit J [Epsilonproteobacteria bacterium]|nr:NADH-quinone oxidoreductase subunit J [Campylobacterota bacterium]
MEAIAFYIFGALITIFFIIAVLSSNVLYAMSALGGGMILISGLFFILDADFLGVVQLIVYVGAVMALYAFAMIFFDMRKNIKEKVDNKGFIIFGGAIIAIILLVIFKGVSYTTAKGFLVPPAGMDNPHAVGVVLFTKYLVPFEVAAVMLLIAMIAGIILASKKMDKSISIEDENIQKDSK